MSELRNLGWLRKKVARKLSVDVAEPDQAYSEDGANPWQEIDDAINEAYELELEDAKTEIDPDRVLGETTITWPANQRTLTLPAFLQNVDLYRVDDETHRTPGDLLWIVARQETYEPEVSWLNRTTLQWGTGGPGETKTLRVFYVPSASEMQNEIDEPDLIPYRFRWLLVWGACILLRAAAQEQTPQKWEEERLRWRQLFQLALSKGSPRSPNRPGVQLTEERRYE